MISTYTLATEELDVLDPSVVTTLEVAERLRDQMVDIFGLTYYVVNMETLTREDA
jgi:hypothetical protein|tara:strand:- start:146 stop:310 length:165 start_codon:yes stop_codon:yes gene_type:complete